MLAHITNACDEVKAILCEIFAEINASMVKNRLIAANEWWQVRAIFFVSPRLLSVSVGFWNCIAVLIYTLKWKIVNLTTICRVDRSVNNNVTVSWYHISKQEFRLCIDSFRIIGLPLKRGASFLNVMERYKTAKWKTVKSTGANKRSTNSSATRKSIRFVLFRNDGE